MNEFWGSYLAILVDRERLSSRILRGPLSRIQCFHALYGELHLFFSHLDDYADLNLSALTVNWDCITAQAAFADYLGRETGINGVDSIEAGECVTVSRDGLFREFYWNPCTIAQQDSFTSFDAAATALKQSTDLSVQSWAKHFGRIVHTLSGGLDSSISVACARKVLPRPDIICLNYFTEHALGDERGFARAAAHDLDVELIEQEREQHVDFSIFENCARTAWPVLDFSGYGQYRKEVKFLKLHGANAMFNGELGDNLFESARFDTAGDFIWRHGIRRGFTQVAIDAAIRANVSIWRILRQAGIEGFRKASLSRWDNHQFTERTLGVKISDITLLKPSALESVRSSVGRFVHPWLQDIAGTPPAKYLMVYAIRMFNNHVPPFAEFGDAPVVSPFASQPLAEVCLRTPTFFNNRGTVNRAVARHAFARELPAAILTRLSKGTPEPWTREAVRGNQPFLKQFLLDGILVKKGILDPKRVEGALSNEPGASPAYLSNLIEQVYIEAWLRAWSTRCTGLAA
ncbi:MAG: asparagine synthase C-terminal domain-containing protein [Steroidobacteraceae bacterium]